MAKNDDVEVIGIQALGMIETLGLVSSIEAADAMAKASNVELLNNFNRLPHIFFTIEI